MRHVHQHANLASVAGLAAKVGARHHVYAIRRINHDVVRDKLVINNQLLQGMTAVLHVDTALIRPRFRSHNLRPDEVEVRRARRERQDTIQIGNGPERAAQLDLAVQDVILQLVDDHELRILDVGVEVADLLVELAHVGVLEVDGVVLGLEEDEAKVGGKVGERIVGHVVGVVAPVELDEESDLGQKHDGEPLQLGMLGQYLGPDRRQRLVEGIARLLGSVQLLVEAVVNLDAVLLLGRQLVIDNGGDALVQLAQGGYVAAPEDVVQKGHLSHGFRRTARLNSLICMRLPQLLPQLLLPLHPLLHLPLMGPPQHLFHIARQRPTDPHGTSQRLTQRQKVHRNGIDPLHP